MKLKRNLKKLLLALTIKNSIINNMSGLGILGQGAYIEGENLLVSNAGQYALALNIGGSYDFKHCTFANYYNLIVELLMLLPPQ